MFKKILVIAGMIFPWAVRRWLLQNLFGYEIHPTAWIGYAWVFPEKLCMGANSRIGTMNVCKGLNLLQLGEYSSIGNLNWISGFPKDHYSPHFADQVNRNPCLLLGDHSAITNRHLIDCTDTVTIGRFSTFAGFRSQILTHSISMAESRQRSGAVSIGDYTFIGTACVILPNSRLPSFSVLGAGSVLNKQYTEEYQLYAGSPARPVKKLGPDLAYFNREAGYII